MEDIADKTLVMIVGPAAVGKSSLMHAVVRQDPRFAYVRSFTTRPDRGDGVSTYQHITEEMALSLQASGAALTLIRHPTTGHAYGTTPESYPARFNLLDTLSGSVGLYRRLPFGRTVTVSLTADPDDWQRWLLGRYPQPGEERTKRLREAVSSIRWSLDQTDGHHWLVNVPDGLDDTAGHLIRLAKKPETGPEPAPPEAVRMLALAESLLSYG